MKHYFFSILLFVFYLNLDAQVTNIYTPDNNKIQYEGRIDFSDSLKPIFAYPGVSIKAAFIGNSISFKIKSYKGIDKRPNYFNIFIDNMFIEKFEINGDTIIKITKTILNKKEHILEITKRTESQFGKVAFLGFEVDGKLINLPKKPKSKIEFIGNSITCGYGNEDVVTNGFNPSLENNYLAYGAVCARELNARYQAVAYSGRGVMFNYGCFEGEIVPDFYEKYIADDKLIGNNIYNHNSYNPDVIVINLGTNDHNCDKLTEDNFKEAYIKFVKKLKGYHPKTKIICLTGPMNSTPKFKERIEHIVAKSGGSNEGIYYFHQTEIIDVSYKGGHGHPNTKMAEINGKELAEFILENNLLATSTSVKKVSKIKLKKSLFKPN